MRDFSVEYSNDTIWLFRKVFSSHHGQEVLNLMLYELGVFRETLSDPEDIALRNYGNKLLNTLAGGEPDPDNIKAFAYNCMKQPLPEERKEDG